MIKDKQFIISIPEIIAESSLGKIKAGADPINFYTQGAQRSTNCCGCHNESNDNVLSE